MEGFLNFKWALGEYYVAEVSYTQILDSVDNTMLPNVSTDSSNAAYARLFRVNKIMIKIKCGMPLLVGFAMVALVLKVMGVFHRDDPTLFTSSEEHVPLIIQTANSFVKIDHKADIFQTSAL